MKWLPDAHCIYSVKRRSIGLLAIGPADAWRDTLTLGTRTSTHTWTTHTHRAHLLPVRYANSQFVHTNTERESANSTSVLNEQRSLCECKWTRHVKRCNNPKLHILFVNCVRLFIFLSGKIPCECLLNDLFLFGATSGWCTSGWCVPARWHTSSLVLQR